MPQRGQLPGTRARISLSIGQIQTRSSGAGTGGTGFCANVPTENSVNRRPNLRILRLYARRGEGVKQAGQVYTAVYLMRRAIPIAILFLALFPALLAHDRITTSITWNREISRIVYDRCASCHNEKGTAFS